MANKIIVTGGNGQLGNCLRDLESRYQSYQFIFTDVAELDITNEKAIADFFKDQKPKWVINAAAYTAVDKAESDKEFAELLNATAVEYLARQSKIVGASLVQISTDYVFDGATEVMLTEDMAVNPQSVYGKTKLAGEKAATLNPAHIILRTSWLYSAYGNNFVKTMRRLGAERKELTVVADQWGSPTLADDLAEAIMTVITAADKGENVYGLYHYSNEGSTCWADFAAHIMTLSGLDCEVKPIPTSDYPTPAARPHFSVMSKNKFKNRFKVVVPEWELSLEYLISKISE